MPSGKQAGEVAQGVKALATKTANLISILRAHIVKEENSPPTRTLRPPCVHWGTHAVPPHINKPIH